MVCDSQGSMSTYTLKDLQKVAELARLRLDPKVEQERLKEFNQIVTYIEVLQQVDTSEVEDSLDAPALPQRADEPETRCSLEEVFQNAPHAQPPFFFIPKVIEGGKK
jgi:aspartyl-tRNA(Asn)/glutamyl-tRNA(Gln) amidotransferase subunit C